MLYLTDPDTGSYPSVERMSDLPFCRVAQTPFRRIVLSSSEGIFNEKTVRCCRSVHVCALPCLRADAEGPRSKPGNPEVGLLRRHVEGSRRNERGPVRPCGKAVERANLQLVCRRFPRRLSWRGNGADRKTRVPEHHRLRSKNQGLHATLH